MGRFAIRLESGATIEVDDRPIGEGAEKAVFKSADDRLAVYFFKSDSVTTDGDPTTSLPNRRRRLEAVRGKFNPTVGHPSAEFWKDHYCWPLDLIARNQALPPALAANGPHQLQLLNPPLGFVAPLYPAHFFFSDKRNGKRREKKPNWFSSPKNRRNVVPPEEQGNLRHYLLACARLARAIRRLHQAGLAHSDLSCNNVLVDPKHGEAMIIDVDSLVVPDVAPPTVIGTQGYIAPEVLAERSQTNGAKYQPGINTDRHALAVLIYELLLGRHPLEGRRIHADDPQLNAHLRYGAEALFIEHPTQTANSLKTPPAVPIARLGPYLEKLFLKTFVDGLHQPSKRASAQEWEIALYKTLDLLHPCPGGKDWTILVPGLPPTCMHTRKPIGYSVPFGTFIELDHKGNETRTDHTIILFDGAPLCRWHLQSGLWPDERIRRPISAEARCVFHRATRRWLLENRSQQPMTVLGPGVTVAPNQAIPLQRGLRIRLAPCGPAPTPTPRILEIGFLQPGSP